ncbi:MAG: ATP-binding cassette domain-containing protein [Verrucomicrobiota bacterium]
MSHFLEIKGLKKSLGGAEILKGIDMHVQEGEKIVVIGRSGGGKSVLLRHILGLMQPDAGSVTFQGTNLSELGEEALNPYRRQIGMLFQNGALFDSMSVRDNLEFPLLEQGVKDRNELSHRVDEALEVVDLPGQHEKLPAELSGGMKKRVALARAAIGRPRLMLYDEPTTGLDPVVADSINHLINRLGEQLKMASIVVTHDMESAYMIADRMYYLQEGEFYFEGTPEEVRNCSDPMVQKFVQGLSDAKDAIM